MRWWRKEKAKTHLTLTARAFDSRSLQLLRTTLAVLRLPEQWQFDPATEAGVVLVDIDNPEGKREWRKLLSSGRYYRVVPMTRDESLQRFTKGLIKPLRSKPLEDLLREVGVELSHLEDESGGEAQAARPMLLCEAMVQSPHDRYGVHLPDGNWFYVERDSDRLFATSGLDSLLSMLFQPMHRMAIKPVRLRPESFASGTASDSYSLSLLLWSATQTRAEVEQLKVLRGDRYFSMHRPMPWHKIPHQADQKTLMDYLEQHGPVDLISLVLEVGISPQRVMAFIAGAWLLGAVKAVVPVPET